MNNKLKLLYSILDDHIILLSQSERIPEAIQNITNEIITLCDIIKDYENEIE